MVCQVGIISNVDAWHGTHSTKRISLQSVSSRMYVSIVWNDRALIVINSVALSIFFNGIISTMVK